MLTLCLVLLVGFVRLVALGSHAIGALVELAVGVTKLNGDVPNSFLPVLDGLEYTGSVIKHDLRWCLKWPIQGSTCRGLRDRWCRCSGWLV